MEKTKVTGMEKVVITKEAKALLAVINKEDMRPHFRGFLIKSNDILATDSKLLARMPLNAELPKEEIPTNIRTGADTDRVWVSAEGMKKAFGSIKKKTALPAIQDNVYINKDNGALNLQVLDENMNVLSIEERGTENLAMDFPDTDKILNPKEDIERQAIVIEGNMFIKLAEMAKALGKNTRIELGIASDIKKPVPFKISEAGNVKVSGVFMLIDNQKK
jgi:hypothetical protein